MASADAPTLTSHSHPPKPNCSSTDAPMLSDADLPHSFKIHCKCTFLLGILADPPIRGAASFLSTLSPWLAFSYELILCLALKLGIYQSFSRYSSASFSKSQVRPSSCWNPSHNKAWYLPRGHYSTNIQKMEYLLDASSRNITP